MVKPLAYDVWVYISSGKLFSYSAFSQVSTFFFKKKKKITTTVWVYSI